MLIAWRDVITWCSGAPVTVDGEFLSEIIKMINVVV